MTCLVQDMIILAVSSCAKYIFPAQEVVGI